MLTLLGFEMSSSLVAVILSLSIFGVSEGMNVENKEEFASGLLHVLNMEHAPNISGRRHAIPRYVFNLYRRKFSRTSLNRGRITWIFFPEGNTAGRGLNPQNVLTILS